PRPAGEELLQSAWRLADFVGQRFERGLFAIVEADLLDGAADDLIVVSRRRDVALQDCGLCVHDDISLSGNIAIGAAVRHPIPAYPALAVASARPNAVAKLSRSSGLRKAPMETCRPSPSTAMPTMPISSCRATRKRVQN